MAVRTDLPANFVGLELYEDMPIPVTVRVYEGVPDWRSINVPILIACLNNRLCCICGKDLDWWITFLGGEESVKQRVFIDGPMHEECARWSIENCPFLAGRKDVSEPLALYVTRSYSVIPTNDRVLVRAARAKRVDWIVEVP